MRTSFTIFGLYLSCLLVASSVGKSVAFLGNKNKNDNDNKRSRPRRRLMEEVAVDDAATGTVMPSQEELDAQEATKTCDGQLAQTLVAANEAKLALEEQLRLALIAKEAAETKVTQLEGSLADTKAKLTTAASGHVDSIDKIKAEYAAKLASLESRSTDTVPRSDFEALEAKFEAQAKEFANTLETSKAEAAKAMDAAVADLKAELEKSAADSKAALEKKDKLLEELSNKNKALTKSESDLKATIKESEEELAHWRETFSNRSYCNVTHISNDLYESSVIAYNQAAASASDAAAKAAEAATQAATQLNYHGTKLAKELTVQADYGYKKGLEMYEEQYRQHWPKIKPHYDEHVNPLVKQFVAWRVKEVDPHLATMNKEYKKLKTETIDPALKALNKERKALFVKMVDAYAVNCKEAYKQGSSLSKENDFVRSIFTKVSPGMRESCQKPELSVTLILRVTLVLALLPFTGFFLRLVWGIIKLIWNIFLTITLIKFCLPRGKAKSGKGEVPAPELAASEDSVFVKRRPGRPQ